eukprot:COSAG02_NODE_9093_length_2334_cov_1.652796_1_plen_688_part_10
MLDACQAMKPRARPRRAVAPLAAAAAEVKLEIKLKAVSKACSQPSKSAARQPVKSLSNKKSSSSHGELIGMEVRKLFPGAGYFHGRVVSLCGTGRCKVKYSDGDTEELDTSEALDLQKQYMTFRSKSGQKELLPGSAWTHADDQRLLKLVEDRGAMSWPTLASHFNKRKPATAHARTASGLRHRYITTFCDNAASETDSEAGNETDSEEDTVVRNKWTDTADKHLLQVKKANSEMSWDTLAESFFNDDHHTRTSSSLRQRFDVLQQKAGPHQKTAIAIAKKVAKNKNKVAPTAAASAADTKGKSVPMQEDSDPSALIPSCWDCDNCSICHETYADLSDSNPDRLLIYFDCEHIHCDDCITEWWRENKNRCPECQRVYPGKRRGTMVPVGEFAAARQKKAAEQAAREARAAKLKAVQARAAAAALKAEQARAAAPAALKAEQARAAAAALKAEQARSDAAAVCTSSSTADNSANQAKQSWTKQHTVWLEKLVDVADEGDWRTKAVAFRSALGTKHSATTLNKHWKAISAGNDSSTTEDVTDEGESPTNRRYQHLYCEDCQNWFNTTADLGVTDEYIDDVGANAWFCPVCVMKPENIIKTKTKNIIKTKTKKYSRMETEDSRLASDLLEEFLEKEAGSNEIEYKITSPDKQMAMVKLVNEELVRRGRQPVYTIVNLINWTKNKNYKQCLK